MSSDSTGIFVGRIWWCAPDVCLLDAIGCMSTSDERFSIRSSIKPFVLGGGGGGWRCLRCLRCLRRLQAAPPPPTSPLPNMKGLLRTGLRNVRWRRGCARSHQEDTRRERTTRCIQQIFRCCRSTSSRARLDLLSEIPCRKPPGYGSNIGRKLPERLQRILSIPDDIYGPWPINMTAVSNYF